MPNYVLLMHFLSAHKSTARVTKTFRIRRYERPTVAALAKAAAAKFCLSVFATRLETLLLVVQRHYIFAFVCIGIVFSFLALRTLTGRFRHRANKQLGPSSH